MPGWHKATRQWVADGRLVLLGITQEQHADRCRLFAQWHGMDWPILHDPINVLEPRAVPIVVAIDEHGIVRSLRPRQDTFADDFMNRTFSPESSAAASSGEQSPARPDLADARRLAETQGTATAYRRLGDLLTLWGEAERINDALGAYRRALKLEPKDGNTLFRLGVCHRMRHESSQRREDDFQASIDFWSRALETNPNQYIWRRRIQQYGPRLDKPYPFYDWVTQAQADITTRGEQPVKLAVAPYGAEIAHPTRRFESSDEPVQAPDPGGRIQRDRQRLIQTETAIVPKQLRAGQSARIHVTFHPNGSLKAHWNNEAEPLRLWIDPPAGWRVSKQLLVAPQGAAAETNEVRRLDFEVQAPATATGTARVRAYTLYYVCEDVGGSCLFLRQDVDIMLTVQP